LAAPWDCLAVGSAIVEDPTHPGASISVHEKDPPGVIGESFCGRGDSSIGDGSGAGTCAAGAGGAGLDVGFFTDPLTVADGLDSNGRGPDEISGTGMATKGDGDREGAGVLCRDAESLNGALAGGSLGRSKT